MRGVDERGSQADRKWVFSGGVEDSGGVVVG
jgi:hypothetical protein